MEARLEAASQVGDLDAFLQLLQEDSFLLDRLSTNPYPYNNPIHIAALLGHADFASEILIRKPELAEDLNEQGSSPLHLASANGHLSVVKELLKLGSDLCLIRDKDGFMPVHIAVIKGKICIVRELIDVCPEAAKAATCQGETVIHLAVKSSRSEAVKFLVEKLGGDDQLLNSKDEKGNTVLHLAVARKQLQILKFLLSKPAIQLNSVNLKGFTPLDVLLESPSEHGDLVLGEMIRAAGGKKAEEESPRETQTHPPIQESPRETQSHPPIQESPRETQSHPPIQESPREAQSHPPIQIANPRGTSLTRSYRKGRLSRFFGLARTRRDLQAEREHENTPEILMVVAALIATVTFQAATNPPGGIVQDGSDAGKAILGDKLSNFLMWDMVGLFASLSIILLLICVVPRKRRILTKFLKWVIWIAVFCTAIAFANALRHIFPFSRATSMIIIFLRGWCGIYGIAMNWLFIRFSFYLLRKAGCFKKRSTASMGCGTVVKRTVLVVILVGVLVLAVFIDWILVELLRDL